MINSSVGYNLYWQDETELSRLKEDIDTIEKLGATHVIIEKEYEYGDSYLSIYPIIKRLETDEECISRETQQKLMEEGQKKRELEMYLKLKAKFEQL